MTGERRGPAGWWRQRSLRARLTLITTAGLALALTGASGFRLAGASPDPRLIRKRRRMPIIAANGLFGLVPAALYLATLASRGEFGMLFYGVQGIELFAGAINLTLMSLNIRDGLSLTAKRRKRSAAAEQLATRG